MLPGLALKWLPAVFLLAGLATTQAAAQVAVDDAVTEAVADGTARVVVELALPGGFDAEGSLSPARARAQRIAIAAAQDAVLAELSGHTVRLMRRPGAIPFLALEIDAAALAALEAMPGRVVRVLPDDTAAPNTRQQRQGEAPDEG